MSWQKRREEGFRWGQIATASLVALSHGTNDAQKTMGVIALALITTGHLTGDVKEDGLPFWIIFSCALAIGLGTYIGGWRVIRTLGKGLVEIESPQGFAAEASSAAIILSSSAAGMALSTTHVATGSILGSGVGKPGAEVRWAVAGRMAVAWLITLPAAGTHGRAGVLALARSRVADRFGPGRRRPDLRHPVSRCPSTSGGAPSSRRSTATTSTPIGTPRPTPSSPPTSARPPKEAQGHGRGLTAPIPTAKETSMTYLESILKVLVVGLVLGAGLPAVFAVGTGRLLERRGRPDADGTVQAPNPALKYLGHPAVRVRRLGDPDRGRLDHQDDDHPPLRFRPVPVHPRGELQTHDREPDCPGQRAELAARGLSGGCSAEGLLRAAGAAEAVADRGGGRQGGPGDPEGERLRHR